MMKTLQKRYIYLILIVFLVSCQHDKEVSEKREWVSTSMYSYLGTGIVLDLSDTDTLLMSGIFNSEDIRKYNYQIDSLNNLIYDDTLFLGNIIKHTNEILVLKDSFNRLSAFIPINDYKLDTDTNNLERLLISNSWQVNNRYGSFRIDYLSEPWPIWNPSPYKMNRYYRMNESKGKESFTSNWWRVEGYKNAYYLIMSYGQIDYQVYQINSISDTAIITETCWSDSVENVVFVANMNLSENNYRNRIDNLTGIWQLIDYEELATGMIVRKEGDKFIKIKHNRKNRPFHENDSVPILLESYFKGKEISYSFSQNSECSMDNDKSNLRKSNWVLSNDGKYIHTKNGWMRSMRIISISDSLLITEKHEIIEYPDKNEWTEKYIREKLRKIAESQKVLFN